jgi:hypothetical protein
MSTRQKSNLIPVGILLILAGFSSGFIARAVTLTPATALLIDGLRLCFFVGLALILIGWVRNRKARTQAP